MGDTGKGGAIGFATGAVVASDGTSLPPFGLPSPIAIVSFTGTQRDMTAAQKEVLLSALIGFREGGAIWMHNGDCIEADEYAGRTWNALGGSIHLHPPTNACKRAFLNELSMVLTAPARPYMARNQDIADAGSVLVATPRDATEQPTGGTWFTIRAARKRGIPAMIILPSGQVIYERWPALAAAAREGGDVQQAPGEAPQSGPERQRSNALPPLSDKEKGE